MLGWSNVYLRLQNTTCMSCAEGGPLTCAAFTCSCQGSETQGKCSLVSQLVPARNQTPAPTCVTIEMQLEWKWNPQTKSSHPSEAKQKKKKQEKGLGLAGSSGNAAVHSSRQQECGFFHLGWSQALLHSRKKNSSPMYVVQLDSFTE